MKTSQHALGKLFSTGIVIGLVLSAVIVSGCNVPQVSGQKSSTIKQADLPRRAYLSLDEIKPEIPAASPLPDQSLTPELQELVDQASGYCEKEQYSKAAELLLSKAVKQSPGNPIVLRELGMCYVKAGDNQKAIDVLSQVSRLDPDNIQTQLELGKLYIRQNDANKALFHIRRAAACSGALDEKPITGEILLYLTALLDNRQYYTASIECYDRLEKNIEKFGWDYSSSPQLQPLVLKPQKLYYNRALVYRKLYKFDLAIADLRRAWSRNRSDNKTPRQMVEIHIQATQYGSAQDLILEMLNNSSQINQLAELCAQLLQASDDAEILKQIWAGAAESKNFNSDTAIELAHQGYRMGQEELSQQILQTILKKSPNDRSVTLFLADLYISKSKPLKAFEILATQFATDSEMHSDLLNKVDELLASGLMVDQAVKQADTFENVRKKAGGYYLAGQMAVRYGKKTAGCELLKKAIELDREFMTPWLGLLYRYAYPKPDLRHIYELREEFSKTTVTTADYYYIFGRMNMLLKETTPAVSQFKNAMDIDPRHVATLGIMGEMLLKAKQYDQAADLLTRAYRIDPKNKYVIRTLQNALGAVDKKEAVEFTANLANRHEKDLEFQLLHFNSLIRFNTPQMAVRYMQTIQRKFPDNPIVELNAISIALGRVKSLLEKQRFDKFAHKYEKLAEKYPDNPKVIKACGDFFKQNGVYEKSIKYYQKLVSVKPQCHLRHSYAKQLMWAGEFSRAQEVLTRLTTDDKDSVEVKSDLLAVLYRQNKYREIAGQIVRWSQIQPPHETKFYMSMMIQTLTLCQDHQLLVDVIEDIINPSFPNDRNMQVFYINELYQAGHSDKAIQIARALFAKDVTRYKVAIFLAEFLREQDQRDVGRMILGKALESAAPDHRPVVKGAIIETLVKNGEIKLGWEMFLANLSKGKPTIEILITSFVNELFAAGQEDLAMEYLHRIITMTTKPVTQPTTMAESQPATRPAQYLAGDNELGYFCMLETVRYLVGKHRYIQAIAKIDDYLQMPKHPKKDLLMLRSHCYSEINQDEKALRDLERAHKEEPYGPTLCNNLGYSLADQGKDLKRARQLIQFSLSRYEYNKPLSALDSLAWVLYRQGKLNRAGRVMLKIFQRARFEYQTHPVMHDHAGDIYHSLGWNKKAQAMWTKALAEARKEQNPSREIKDILENTPKKLQKLNPTQVGQ